jgi:hypothetical protein
MANGNSTAFVWNSLNYSSSGGAGSGGSILLQIATGALGTNNVAANGGGAECGGSGGVGRIAVWYAESFTGGSTPDAYTIYDTNSDNVTAITNNLIPQTNFLGSNALFTVGATGFPPLYYQWSFNGVPISGATNQTLSLVDLAFTNQGTYSVAISNFVGTVLSSNAYLTVLDPREPWGDGIPNWWKEEYGLVGNSPINNIDPYGLQVPAPMNLVVGFGPGYGQSISDYNNQVQSAANTSLPMITGALAATATGGLADAGLVGTGLMSPGIASGFATGALAASAGDAASQATAMALGNQQNFDPGQMAAAGATGGLLGGAAAGVAKAMSKPCPPKMGKGIVHNDQVVAHAPIEAVASHEALARQSGTLLTPPLAGTPGQLIPGAEAFTYTAQGGNVFVTGSMNFNQNVSVNVVQVVTRYVNGN